MVFTKKSASSHSLTWYINDGIQHGNSSSTAPAGTDISILPVHAYSGQRIAELRVWNNAISGTNLRRTVEVSPGTANLVGLYTFQDPTNLCKNTA